MPESVKPVHTASSFRPIRWFARSILRWFDSSADSHQASYDKGQESYAIDWVRTAPFIGLHLMCFGIIWVGTSWIAVGVAALLYFLRMFSLTSFYHRYFSHRTFKTNRFWQFIFAAAGNSCVQRGPLWWAAHHRDHHRYSDKEGDIHSPVQHGFFWSHMGWVMGKSSKGSNKDNIKDFAKFPELRFLDRFHVLVPVLLAVGVYYLGVWLEHAAPHLGTNGPQMLIWGFFVSTVVLFHGTCTINSLAHVIGKKRFPTGDESRNHFGLALITLGEGWHNNHHYYPASTRQGFYWWEVDISYYMLRVLAFLRIIKDLKSPPKRILEQGRAIDRGKQAAA